MQTKNFKGQDLRGRSFKGQDLTGADFSDCDLRGVDFSFANLSDGKFCNARMGGTSKTNFVQLLLQLFAGVCAGAINGVASVTISEIGSFFWVRENHLIKFPLLEITLANTLFTSAIILLAVKFHRQNFLLWLFSPLIIGTGAIAGIAAGALAGAGVVIIPITGAFAGALVGFVGALYPVTNTASILGIPFGFMAGFESSVIYLLLGIYLGTQAVNKQEPTLFYLRQLSIKLRCLGGTQFTFANLNQVNFSNTNLKYTRFKNAKFHNCNFHNTKNHHLALTEGTVLEPRKVRDLIIVGIITDKNFSTLDLRGLDFSNLNLQGFDFSHANLSGANLSHTQMTGAILEGWAIDTETRLDDIECSYYYYLDNGEKKRMPPEGEEYKAGEFTRIFQKIANTIDFIAHNEMELAAIKLSVEQVRVESGNDDIRVQTIEEKNGVIVVKVAVPKFEDRGILYHELKQKNTQIQLRLRDKSHRIKELRSEIDILKNQINEKRQTLTIIVKDSTINNDGGVVNFGEINGNISQQNTL